MWAEEWKMKNQDLLCKHFPASGDQFWFPTAASPKLNLPLISESINTQTELSASTLQLLIQAFMEEKVAVMLHILLI